jgi:hypothetical protein
MARDLRLAILAALLYLVTYTATAGTIALSYQEATWRCSIGDLEACEVMYAYETARMRERSPADKWVGEEALQREGSSAITHGPSSAFESIR